MLSSPVTPLPITARCCKPLLPKNALETLGHNCRIIDYVRPGEVCTQLHKCQLQQKPRWNRTPLRRRVYSTLCYTENVMAGRLFESARRQMLHLTAPYSTAQELTANGPKADVYMTGSDQVWGPMEDCTYDPVYRLTFAPEGAKKVAYAASFGSTELSKPLRGQFCRGPAAICHHHRTGGQRHCAAAPTWTGGQAGDRPGVFAG